MKGCWSSSDRAVGERQTNEAGRTVLYHVHTVYCAVVREVIFFMKECTPVPHVSKRVQVHYA